MKKFNNDEKAGLYITAIIHLAVIIVLLACQIRSTVRNGNSFLLDFSAQERKEEKQRKEELHQSAIDKLEQMLAAAEVNAGAPVRNVTVNASEQTLKDDRNTDAEQLYKDAERLKQELLDGHNQKDDDFADISKPAPKKENKKEEKKKAYSGPSVLSWTLEGRKASKLPIPAYRCMGAGQVTVSISVDNSGRVMDARVVDAASSSDRCLREFAVRAARLSRFSASATAPARQQGSIVYSFIAQ